MSSGGSRRRRRKKKREEEEEAMRPNKAEIDVALAAATRRVTQGQVSSEKLNRPNTLLLPPAKSDLNKAANVLIDFI